MHTILRLLSRRFDFSLLSFVRSSEEYWHVPSLKKYCRNVIAVPLEQDALPEREDFLNPAIVKSCFSRRFVACLQDILEQEQPDLVHIEFIQMAIYRQWIKDCPVLLTEHDMSNISFFRSYFREMTGWQRWGRIVEWMRLVRYQIHASRDFDGIITLTPNDTSKLQSYLPDRHVRCIPTGVDLEHFQLGPRVLARRRSPEVNLVYVGHYMHYPNEDAMLYFAHKIFPSIVEQCPIARLWIVGSGVTKAIESLRNNPRINVTGAVPDVKPFLDKADVYVAPLRLGEGIKGKILEAFAVGIPVVSTSVGVRGLGAVDGDHVLVSDKPKDFAALTVRAAFDQSLRRRLIKNGRIFVEKNYDWRVLAGRVADFYREMINARSA